MTAETPKRKAGGYYRVSSEDQRKGISLEMQPDKIRLYAQVYNFDLHEPLFHDDGLSGRSATKRPEVQRAIEWACDEKAALIVYSMSRFIRNTEEGLALERRLRKAGAALCSITEYFDTGTANGLFVFTIILAKDQLESGQTSERTRDCLKTCKTNGRIWSGLPVYGLMRDENRPEINRKTKQTYFPHLIDNPDEQKVLDKMVFYANIGKKPDQIAAELTAACIWNREGRSWHPRSIRRILKSQNT